MPAIFAVALYRCEIAGKSTGSIDVQVRYFPDLATDVEEFLRTDPLQAYENAQGETVRWLFVRVLAVEEATNPQAGQEVVGFITDIESLAKLASADGA